MNNLNQLDQKVKLEVEEKIMDLAIEVAQAHTMGTYTPEELVKYCKKVAYDICELTGINKGGIYVL